MTSPRVNWEINLGHILIIVSLVIGGLAAWSDAKSDIAVNATNIAASEKRQDIMERRMDANMAAIRSSLQRIEDKLDTKVDK